MSGAIDDLWSRLARVTRFETRSSSEQGGVDGSIAGAVEVSREGDRLRFEERGVATLEGGRSLDTRNAITWTRRGDSIDVAHERLSAAHPVALVRLYGSHDGVFVSEAPHLCGDDRYSCTARLHDHAIEVEWAITGPRKRATVATTYS